MPDGLRSLGLGGVAIASYGAGSTLHYNELIIYTLARRGLSVGAWINHIYVDDVTSLRGGREIWGLPKALAAFQWGTQGVEVTTSEGPLIRVQFTPALHGWPLPALIAAIGRSPGAQSDGQPCGPVRWFLAHGWMRIRVAEVRVQCAAAAPFAGFGLERVWVGGCGPLLSLRVQA